MKKTYKRLLKKYSIEVVKSVLWLVLISILSILGPLLLKEAVDYNVKKGFEIDKIAGYILVLTLLFIAKFIYNRFKFYFEEKFKNFETEKLYQEIFKMSYEMINKMEPTYLTERVNSTVNTIFSLYSSSISGIFVSALTMIMILAIISKINWILAVLYFLQIPLQYIGFQKLLNGENSKLSAYGVLLQETSARNNKNIKAVMSDVESIKQFGESTGIISFIKKNVSEINKISREGNQYAMDVCTILEYICQIVKNASYIFIIYLYITGRATVGDIVYLNLMNDIYYGSVSDVISIQVNLRDLKAAMKFIVEEVEKNKEDDGCIEISGVCSLSGQIKKMGYENIELIKEGSFNFEKGDIVALKGNSGVGKSTFVKYLNKFLISNEIFVNGINIKEISNDSLRKKIFYLAQNAYLLPLSIKENITLGENYDKQRWNMLLEMEFMKKFLGLEEGLETKVYENGANLSGGDRQKIMLGRIFLRNPDVIILDESFNALDEKTGEEIMEEILNMYSDKIVIIISHSEKYLKKCNVIVTIKNKQLSQKNN